MYFDNYFSVPIHAGGWIESSVRLELKFLHHLLEFSNRGHNRSDRFRLAPIRIATTFCHSYALFRFQYL